MFATIIALSLFPEANIVKAVKESEGQVKDGVDAKPLYYVKLPHPPTPPPRFTEKEEVAKQILESTCKDVGIDLETVVQNTVDVTSLEELLKQLRDVDTETLIAISSSLVEAAAAAEQSRAETEADRVVAEKLQEQERESDADALDKLDKVSNVDSGDDGDADASDGEPSSEGEEGSESSASEEASPVAPTEPKAAQAVAAASQQAVNEAKEKADALKIGEANSRSHNAEWKVFNRQCGNRSLFPKDLAPEYKENKQGLFNLWLANGRSLKKCSFHIRRTLRKKQARKVRYGWRKESQMVKDLGYSEESAAAIAKNRVSKKKYLEDPEDPTNPKEYYYYVRIFMDTEFETALEDELGLSAGESADEDMVKDMTGEHGALRDNANFETVGHDTADAGALHDALTSCTPVKKRKKDTPTPPDPKAEKAEQPQPIEEAKALMEDVLNKMTEARKNAIALQSVDMGKDLQAQLKQHAHRLEVAHDMVNKLIRDGCNDKGKYAKIKEKVQKWFDWYTPREKVAKDMLKPFKAKAKAKGAAKAKAKALAAQVT